MNMTCEHMDSLLSAWFEGDLAEAERRAVDAHLRECLRCASLVRDLESIRREAAALPAMAPSRDLWEGIAARIETPVVDLKSRAAHASAPRAWRMAAAAVVLMAVSSGVTYLVLTGNQRSAAGNQQSASTSTPDSATVPVATTPGVVTPKRPTTGSGKAVLVGDLTTPELIYDQEITRLRAILEQRRGDLDSTTVKTVEKSLLAIDQAIVDARRALTGDASNAFLNEQLNRALEKKLGVLRRVALLPVGAS